MALRISNRADLARIVEIYNSSIEWRLSTADTSPVSIQSKKGWFNSHSKKRPLFVYEEGSKMLAWASILPFNERPAYKNTVELSIYIDHDHIGKGLGAKILAQLIELLPSLNIKTVIANIYSHNEASLRLFSSYGFKEWGELLNVCEMDGKKYNVSILGLEVDHT